MNFTYDFSGGNTKFTYHSQPGETLDREAWQSIQELAGSPFLLPVVLEQHGETAAFTFDIAGMINLLAWMESATYEEQNQMRQNAQYALQQLQYYIPGEELLLDEKYQYVDLHTGTVRFICLPLKKAAAAPAWQQKPQLPPVPPSPTDSFLLEEEPRIEKKKKKLFGRKKDKKTKQESGWYGDHEEPETPYSEKLYGGYGEPAQPEVPYQENLYGGYGEPAQPEVPYQENLYGGYGEPVQPEVPYRGEGYDGCGEPKHPETLYQEHLHGDYGEPVQPESSAVGGKAAETAADSKFLSYETSKALEEEKHKWNISFGPIDESWKEASGSTEAAGEEPDCDEEDDGDDGTVLLRDDGADATVLLKMPRRPKATLTREKTKEQFTIDKEVCKIGKKASAVDICLRGNPTVSREHCIIRILDGEFYLEDCGSSNDTYLEGKQVMPGQPEKLPKNCTIQISDETFLFQEEEDGGKSI